MNEAIQRAFDAVGGPAALAKKLGRSRQAADQWRRKGAPVELCPDIEDLTGVRCEALRPDVNWGVLRKAPRLVKTA